MITGIIFTLLNETARTGTKCDVCENRRAGKVFANVRDRIYFFCLECIETNFVIAKKLGKSLKKENVTYLRKNYEEK